MSRCLKQTSKPLGCARTDSSSTALVPAKSKATMATIGRRPSSPRSPLWQQTAFASPQATASSTAHRPPRHHRATTNVYSTGHHLLPRMAPRHRRPSATSSRPPHNPHMIGHCRRPVHRCETCVNTGRRPDDSPPQHLIPIRQARLVPDTETLTSSPGWPLATSNGVT